VREVFSVRDCSETDCRTTVRRIIYLLTAIGLTPGGSNTAHIYIQTIRRTTQLMRTTKLTTEQHSQQQKQHN
jgi:hypothetical protein